MIIKSKHKTQNSEADIHSASESGFTLIEVMLVLGITGMMLLGLIGGSFSSIARQRYNDSLRSFAEYLSGVYSEVLAPATLGLGNSKDKAILGKVLVFGSTNDSTVYSVTLVGSAEVAPSSESFIEELAHDGELQLYCGTNTIDETSSSTVASYKPLWEAILQQDSDNSAGQPFKGTMIVSRTSSSSNIHTAFKKDFTLDLANGCTPDNHSANDAFRSDLQNSPPDSYNTSDAIGICLKSEDSAIIREVRLSADARNASAISVLSEGDSLCQ